MSGSGSNNNTGNGNGGGGVPVATSALSSVPDSRLSRRPLLVQIEYACYWAIALGINAYGLFRIHKASVDPRAIANSRYQLSPAWFGADTFVGVDLTDTQLANFLSNLPLLIVAMAGYVAVSRFVRANAPALLLPTHLALNTGFLLYLHGVTVIFMAIIFAINFAWSRLAGKMPFTLYYGAAWVFHLAILFSNDIYKGYRFAWLSPSLQWLDDMGGGTMRWHVLFNMSTLRMIGFLYDAWEANGPKADQTRADQEAKHAENCADCAETKTPCHRLRTSIPRPRVEYSAAHYVAFLTYIPLYIGGPLTSFNAYVSHLHVPQRAFDARKCGIYAGRIVGLYVCLVALLHVNHLSTLRNDAAAFDRMPVPDKMLYGILFLAFLWLKFNLIWKFFRLVAIFDGVEAPEDMNRCFSNTTTVADFWRDWHASFNQWIVRYMYVPMGGNRAKAATIVPIFVFIAVWHDIELHLLWWAGIMCVAFVPELVVGTWFAKKCKWMRDRPYYRHVRALGCALSTLSLVIANLFGYGTGMSSAKGVEGLAGSAAMGIWTLVFLFSSSNIGLQERAVRSEAEMRRKAQCGLVKSQ